MVKTWNADRIFPSIEPFYREMERSVGGSFLRSIPIYRPFLNVAEQNEWQEKSVDPSFSPYISSLTTDSQYDQVNDPYGGIILQHSGFVEIPAMMAAMESYLKRWRVGPGAFCNE